MTTAKQRFLESDHAKAFFDMAANPILLSALDYAMLEMVRTESPGLDGNAAARTGLRIDGAKRFVEILLDLPVVPPKRSQSKIPANLPEP